MKNLNLLFNKLYYENLDSTEVLKADIKKYNELLFSENLFDPQRDYQKPVEKAVCFRLETAYPGMILGSGNPHGVHMTDNDVNMGFSFDFVTGQPYIPGSSVKGVLRSCFEQYPDMVRDLTGCNDLNMKAMVNELFEGDDVFLDAVICRGDVRGRLIGEDYITPHPDPLKDPKPVHLIKIMPGVGIEFRFIPKPQEDTDMISAEAKVKLYKALLKLFGVGAKTNVGYGILKDYDPNRVSLTVPAARETSERNTNRNQPASSGSRPAPQRSNTSPNRQSEHPTCSGDETISMKICPNCGKRNYKYKQDSTQVNWNWDKNVCFACRRNLG
jgi:CRISPR-associated protein Cmr6